MSQFRESTFPGVADASLNGVGRYRRVKITGAVNADGSWPVGLAGVNDVGVGVMDNQQANATGARVNVWLNNDNKTKIMVANAAITANTYVYAAASGKIAPTGTVIVALALESATADGDFIECLPIIALGKSAGGNVAPTVLSGAADAINPHLSADYVLTRAGVQSETLAAPTAGTDDGVTITVQSTTNFAHTITATGLLKTGAATTDVATFAAFGGASVTLRAYNGKWVVVSANAITFS